MPNSRVSPAVQSLLKEQTTQRVATRKGTLETGLEDTFPASDPVSATHTSVSTGHADIDEANRAVDPEQEHSYPLVEDAMRSLRNSNRGVSGDGRVQALRRDAEKLSESAGDVAVGAVSLAKQEAFSFRTDIEERIRASPLIAVGIVAALAFVWGATR